MVAEARQVAEWTRSQLDKEQLDFLAALPMSIVDGPLLFVHANAWAPRDWEYIVGRVDAVRSLHATDARFTFCGHMHVPMLFHLTATGKAGDFSPTPGIAIPLSDQRQWLVLPGSSGQPRDGNPAACYAMFETETHTLTFHRVPYDHEAAGARIRAAGLPDRLAERLSHGD
jgi:diadenosine tetraphosphatase ApaH/serine/threonine PP2A family protein phosphatase